jgi:hypothetical protein
MFMDGTFTLRPCQSIYSPNKKHQLEMQGDGHLVQYKLNDDGSRDIVWESNTNGHADEAYAWFQTDANLVVYTPDGQAKWYARDMLANAVGNNEHKRFDFVAVGSFFALPDEGHIYIVVVPTAGHGPYMHLDLYW